MSTSYNKNSEDINKTTGNYNFSKFLPLLSILLIDSMGMGILFPILAVAFMNPTSHFIALQSSHTTRVMEYSVAVSVFMFCWFIGSSVLGRYSDIKGRKPALMISLSGAAIGYTTAFIALSIHSFALLVASRVIAGLTSGIQPIAWATIADGSADDNLSRNMGFVVMTICLGYVAGPLLASIFTDSNLYHWFMLQTPILIAAILSLFNLVLLYYSFEDISHTKNQNKLNITDSILAIYKACQHPQIRYLCMVFFLFVAAWISFYSYIDVYLVGLFHYSATMSSLFSTCLGAGFCVGSGFINAKLSGFSAKKLATSTMLIAAAGCLTVAAISNQILIWITSFIIGCAIYIAMPNILTLFSQKVGPAQQGWAMGVCGSMFALSFGITSLITGYMGSIWVIMPIIISGLGLIFTTILLYINKA